MRNAFNTMAMVPLLGRKSLYQDVASYTGIDWRFLAACDWMQCRAQARYSPVQGEKLGTTNPDGTVYRTKSEALEQCGNDLIELAWAVYRIDVAAPATLSVRDLANTFAAFRWGGLLRTAPHVGDGVPLLGGGPHRTAHRHALAQDRRPERP